ncbi:hypothetical protein ABH935_007719 [Catenulispora sp. GAS73]
MSALCDMLGCAPADLIATSAQNAGVRKTASGDVPAPGAVVAKLRPRPAGSWTSRDHGRADRAVAQAHLRPPRLVAEVCPDGPACRTCADRAVRTRGVCLGCGTDRALPGRRPRRLCPRCTLADRLDERLDDGTGRIRPALAPLTGLLLSAEKPLSILTWLHTRKPQQVGPAYLLRRLGRGEIELTHAAFNTLHPWRGAAHLQELLTSCGILPAADKQICLLER